MHPQIETMVFHLERILMRSSLNISCKKGEHSGRFMHDPNKMQRIPFQGMGFSWHASILMNWIYGWNKLSLMRSKASREPMWVSASLWVISIHVIDIQSSTERIPMQLESFFFNKMFILYASKDFKDGKMHYALNAGGLVRKDIRCKVMP